MSALDSRALLAALYDAAVQGAAPFPCTRDAVARWCGAHAVNDRTRVHVIATGKASPAMMAGALAALYDCSAQIVGTIVVAAHDPVATDWFGVSRPATMRVMRGDHPVPGPASLDAADAAREDLQLDVASSLSDLRDLDYAEALARMNQQLVGLQAAQMSYSQISQLSLFNYLR